MKIRNTDIAWFRRGAGNTSDASGYALQGGVRMTFTRREFTGNDNLAAAGGTALRGTGCPAAEAPVFWNSVTLRGHGPGGARAMLRPESAEAVARRSKRLRGPGSNWRSDPAVPIIRWIKDFE